MIRFIKDIIFIISNYSDIKKSLKVYNDENTHKAIEYYNYIKNNIEKAFNSTNYNFNNSIINLNKIKSSINNLNNRNDYKLTQQGYSATQIVNYYKKEHLFIIINTLKYSNPLYEIDVSDSDKKYMKIIIDTPINPNDFVGILDNIFSNISDYEMDYAIFKSYPKDRLCYSIELKSNNIYFALSDFIKKLNENIYYFIENQIKEMDSNFVKVLYDICKNFNDNFQEINILDKLSFGKKEEIIDIINNNKLFVKNINSLLLNNIYLSK